MATAAQFRTEHLATAPRGYRVRSVKRGSHVVRVAFPPGPRRKGSGKVLEILHPRAERNSSCIVTQRAKSNPSELLIFGNPSTLPAKRAARERAARIRGARLNPKATPEKIEWARNQVRRVLDHIPAAMATKLIRGRAVKPSGKVTAEKIEWARNEIRRVLDHVSRSEAAKLVRGRSNPRRRNSSEGEQAVRLFQSFHGRDPKSVIEKHVSTEIRKDYTALGDLISLKVKTPIGEHAEFSFDGDGVKLACSPNGKQLYCIGGKQNVLDLLDSASQQKDLIDLGECIEVAYLARKAHSNFEPVEWYHKFGEKGGTRPQLMFDKLRRQIFFVGGEYYIDGNVDLSPGIEN